MTKYKKILVTGGAGFIGSHLVDGLINKGYQVRVLDNLYKQIHPTGKLPDYFNKKAQFIRGDVTKRSDWIAALKGIDAVFHFASAVGVGQSMYEIEHYVKVNSLGTAIFLDILANSKHTVKKMIVAASMSSYGEGSYFCHKCGKVRPPLRSEAKLAKKDFEVYCPNCGQKVSPITTDEEAKQNSNSIYAISKKNQEEMVANIGLAYNIPAVALRYFNVYGPRQSLSNPYNGVAAIFMSRIKNGKPPIINEDGLQTRDFINIADVTAANIACLESEKANYQVFNVGSGHPITIKELAQTLIRLYAQKHLEGGPPTSSNLWRDSFKVNELQPEITGKVRKLDVKHCYADIARIKKLVGWRPKVKFADGLKEVIADSEKQKAVDLVDEAMRQLEKRGLR